jgi:hypothetical protein
VYFLHKLVKVAIAVGAARRGFPWGDVHPRRALSRSPFGGSGAQVAQLVEHCTENAGVGGSIPPLGTTVIFEL